MDEVSKARGFRQWMAENFQELAVLTAGLLVLTLIGAAIVIRY